MHMTQRPFVFILMTLIAVLLTLLTVASVQAGQSLIPAAFVDIGLGAREMGMGGANVAGSGRAVDLVWNPAGLAALERSEITAMQTDQFGTVPTYFLAGARPWGTGRGLALGFVSSGDALLRENTLVAAAAQRLGGSRGVELGAALKLRQASFGPPNGNEGVSGHAYGAALDLGLRGWMGPMDLGLLLEEVPSILRWSSSAMGSYHEAVPPTFTAGMGFRSGPLRFASDLDFRLGSERPFKLALGLEWTAHPILQLRGGLRQRLDAEGSRFLSLGAGLGYDFDEGGRMQLDTAYLFHDLANSLRVSAGYLF